jgi:hypothetical protein
VRPVQKLYSLQNALQLEELMNDDLGSFCAQLESRFMEGINKGKTCDIADWISFFAWDFLGHMTWSKRMGFMEKGADIGGMLGTAERVMRYFSVVCTCSCLTPKATPQHRLYLRSPICQWYVMYFGFCLVKVLRKCTIYCLLLVHGLSLHLSYITWY